MKSVLFYMMVALARLALCGYDFVPAASAPKYGEGLALDGGQQNN